MWLSVSVFRRRLRRIDCLTSDFRYCVKPLFLLGFVPYGYAFVTAGQQRPVVAFHFINEKTKDRVVFVFGRAIPMHFIHVVGKKRVRSPEYAIIENFERGLAAYFKIKSFSPEKRPVLDWPPRPKLRS